MQIAISVCLGYYMFIEPAESVLKLFRNLKNVEGSQ